MKKASIIGYYGLIIAFTLIIIFKLFIFQTYALEQSSMEPTFYEGDTVTGSTIYFSLKQSDIVIVESFWGDLICKRIAATPGDSVSLKNNTLYVNGVSYCNLEGVNESFDIKLKNSEYFVVGDNVNNSYDSLDFGPIPEKVIKSKIKTTTLR